MGGLRIDLERQKDLFKRFFYEGQDIGFISTVLNISESAITQHLRRITRSLISEHTNGKGEILLEGVFPRVVSKLRMIDLENNREVIQKLYAEVIGTERDPFFDREKVAEPVNSSSVTEELDEALNQTIDDGDPELAARIRLYKNYHSPIEVKGTPCRLYIPDMLVMSEIDNTTLGKFDTWKELEEWLNIQGAKNLPTNDDLMGDNAHAHSNGIAYSVAIPGLLHVDFGSTFLEKPDTEIAKAFFRNNGTNLPDFQIEGYSATVEVIGEAPMKIYETDKLEETTFRFPRMLVAHSTNSLLIDEENSEEELTARDKFYKNRTQDYAGDALLFTDDRLIEVYQFIRAISEYTENIHVDIQIRS